jgi:8-oxo-dGTP diphosphatase
MRQDYCAGFAFSADRSKIVLIEKNRPAWQAGKLNGVGGKLEAGETPMAAMVREFFEETGVATLESDWHYYTKVIGRDGDVFFFRLFDDKMLSATTKLDEEVKILDVDFGMIRERGLSNLLWLIGIALDTTLPHFFVKANYNQEFITGKTGT